MKYKVIDNVTKKVKQIDYGYRYLHGACNIYTPVIKPKSAPSAIQNACYKILNFLLTDWWCHQAVTVKADISLSNIASVQLVLFGMLHVCTYNACIMIYLCAPFLFADSLGCQFVAALWLHCICSGNCSDWIDCSFCCSSFVYLWHSENGV